jgi:hypothetical protein
MKLKVIFLTIIMGYLGGGLAYAVTSITTDKENYTINEQINITYVGMAGMQTDWFAIYIYGSSTAGTNIIDGGYWEYTNGNINGNHTFNNLPEGRYELRAFFNNSSNIETVHAFTVGTPPSLATNKNTYLPNESIVINFDDMLGDSEDWIAIYPVGSSNAWGNVIRWDYLGENISGSITLSPLPVGNYEIRGFFQNSFIDVATYPIVVQPALSLSLNQENHNSTDEIVINFTNMQGDVHDWIGIYPVGISSEPFSNVLRWEYTNGLNNGTISFNALPAGEYEVRGFFQNSFDIESTQSLTVENNSKVCTDINNVDPCSVSTFHNLSLYWSPIGGDVNKKVTIEYALQGTKEWKKAQSLVYNPIISPITYTYPSSNPQNPRPHIQVNANDVVSKADYRGSIVNLAPNSNYTIKMTLEGGETKFIDASTWNETFSIQQTYSISNGGCENYNVGDTTCSINQEGSKENGYVVIDGENQTLESIELTGKEYIIIRNFKLEGASKNAIYLQKNSHHIVIEDCDISAWGRISSQKDVNGVAGVFAEFGEEDPAIFCEFNLSSSIIQRNKIYNPTYGTNSWAEPHGRSEITVDDYNVLLANNPNNLSIGEDGGKYYKEEHHSAGPQGVTFWFSEKGNNVIRYNEIYSNNGNYLYDPMGGVANKGHYGFPGADSDIYGNYIANSWDDGIEVEGGGENIRLWNNYIEKTYIGIANAVTSVGPLYIWRNVSGVAGEMVIDNDKKLNKLNLPLYSAFLKMGHAGGSSLNLMTGNIHVYNNTILNSNNDGYGGLGTSTINDNRIMRNIKTRNNILHVRANGGNSISKGANDSDEATEDYNYDMLSSLLSPYLNQEENGLLATTPTYNNLKIPNFNNNIEDKKGNFKLSFHKGEGICIPNFISKNILNQVDMGADDSADATLMLFGIDYNFNNNIPLNNNNCDIP